MVLVTSIVPSMLARHFVSRFFCTRLLCVLTQHSHHIVCSLPTLLEHPYHVPSSYAFSYSYEGLRMGWNNPFSEINANKCDRGQLPWAQHKSTIQLLQLCTQYELCKPCAFEWPPSKTWVSLPQQQLVRLRKLRHSWSLLASSCFYFENYSRFWVSQVHSVVWLFCSVRYWSYLLDILSQVRNHRLN